MWNCEKNVHETEIYNSDGFTLFIKLFIISEKEISLYDLLSINPRCHLFTTHIAVVASKLIALLITPAMCLVLNSNLMHLFEITRLSPVPIGR